MPTVALCEDELGKSDILDAGRAADFVACGQGGWQDVDYKALRPSLAPRLR